MVIFIGKMVIKENKEKVSQVETVFHQKEGCTKKI